MYRRTLLRTFGLGGAALIGLGGVSSATGDDDRVDVVAQCRLSELDEVPVPDPAAELTEIVHERVPAIKRASIDHVLTGGVLRGRTVERGQLMATGAFPVDELAADLKDDALGFERIPVRNTKSRVYRASASPLVVGVAEDRMLLATDRTQEGAFTRFREILESPRPRARFRAVPDRLAGFDHSIAMRLDGSGSDRIPSRFDDADEDVRDIVAGASGIGMGAILSSSGGALRYCLAMSEGADGGAAIDAIAARLASDDRVDRVAVDGGERLHQIDVRVDPASVYDVHAEALTE